MKQSEDNQLDKHFAQAFVNFEVEPSNSVWMGIEKELDKNSKYVRNLWITRLSIAASIALFITVGIFYFNIDINKSNTISEVQNNSSETSTTNKFEKLIPNEAINDKALADVVEIISKPAKQVKKANTNPVKPAKNTNTPESKKQEQTIEPNKVALDIATENNLAENKVEIPLNQQYNEEVIEMNEVPTTALVSLPDQPANTKREIKNVVSAVNYLSERISGDKSTLIAINNAADESGRKSYQIDLGFVKLTRIKNTNN